MTIFSLNIKGSAKTATDAAKRWGCHVFRVHYDSKSDMETSTIVADCSLHMVGRWFGDAPFAAPFPPGTLLHYRELEDAEARAEAEAFDRGWAAEQRGVKLDFDDDKGAISAVDEEVQLGSRVRIAQGSGINSGHTGRVVSPTSVRTDRRGVPTNVRGAYRPIDWSREVAVRLDNGVLITMFVDQLQVIPESGLRLDFDIDDASGISGLEGGNLSVSTLTPGLHGKPSYRYFGELSEALQYARTRALRGPRMRAGGKAYFILDHSGVLYRVFRGMRGQEQRRGAEHPERNREFIVVQKNAGLLPNGKTRWVWDHAQSIEIEDP
jgi:hypothetical protein